MKRYELLTEGEDGRVAEGVVISLSDGERVARYFEPAPKLSRGSEPRDLRWAYRHTPEVREAFLHSFYKLSILGKPIPSTLVEFLVPRYLLTPDKEPSYRALVLVGERMCWE